MGRAEEATQRRRWRIRRIVIKVPRPHCFPSILDIEMRKAPFIDWLRIYVNKKRERREEQCFFFSPENWKASEQEENIKRIWIHESLFFIIFFFSFSFLFNVKWLFVHKMELRNVNKVETQKERKREILKNNKEIVNQQTRFLKEKTRKNSA